jgi:hypothetical protein
MLRIAMLERWRRLPSNAGSPTSAQGANDLGRYPSHYLLVLTGVFGYLLAKHIVSGGQVSLDQFEYWLLGIFAIAIILMMGRLSHVIDGGRGSVRLDSLLLVRCWVYSLICFVVLRASLYSETFEFPIYSALKYNFTYSHLAITAIYSLLGCAVAVAIPMLRRGEFPLRMQELPGICLNFALFLVLMFMI